MLYFSKFRIILISLFTLIFVYLTSSNFIKFDDNWIDKKINLGLDLQGGSYLLLEIDNQPVIVQKLQNTVSILRKYFKDNNIFFKNLRIIEDESIVFEIENNQIEQIKSLLEDKNGNINPYYSQYKSYQFDLLISDNQFQLDFSKFGLIELKNLSIMVLDIEEFTKYY